MIDFFHDLKEFGSDLNYFEIYFENAPYGFIS